MRLILSIIHYLLLTQPSNNSFQKTLALDNLILVYDNALTLRPAKGFTPQPGIVDLEIDDTEVPALVAIEDDTLDMALRTRKLRAKL